MFDNRNGTLANQADVGHKSRRSGAVCPIELRLVPYTEPWM